MLASAGHRQDHAVLQLFACHLHGAPGILLLPCAQLVVGAHSPGKNMTYKREKQGQLSSRCLASPFCSERSLGHKGEFQPWPIAAWQRPSLWGFRKAGKSQKMMDKSFVIPEPQSLHIAKDFSLLLDMPFKTLHDWPFPKPYSTLHSQDQLPLRLFWMFLSVPRNLSFAYHKPSRCSTSPTSSGTLPR